MKWRQIRLSGEYQRWTSLNCYERLIVTSGGHYRAASLLFAHSMLRETTLHERAPLVWMSKNIILFDRNFGRTNPKFPMYSSLRESKAVISGP